jgi:hypothetical protein
MSLEMKTNAIKHPMTLCKTLNPSKIVNKEAGEIKGTMTPLI